MRRWLVAGMGLAFALAAIYALLTGVFLEETGAPSERIDERSRAGLREALIAAGKKDEAAVVLRSILGNESAQSSHRQRAEALLEGL